MIDKNEGRRLENTNYGHLQAPERVISTFGYIFITKNACPVREALTFYGTIMPILLFEIFLFFALLNGDNAVLVQEDKTYTVSEVSVKPVPVKGQNDFNDKWSKKVVYPEYAINQEIQGVVFIEFVVNKDGTITDTAVKSGIGFGCDEAALGGFNELNKKEIWKPGVKNGQPVKVKMVLPFFFRITRR